MLRRTFESAAVSEPAGSLDGRVLLQPEEGYAAAKKVWNGMFDPFVNMLID